MYCRRMTIQEGRQRRQHEDLGQHFLTEHGIRCENQFQPLAWHFGQAIDLPAKIPMKTQLAGLLWDRVGSVMHFEVLKRTQLRKYKDRRKHKPCTGQCEPCTELSS